MRSKFVQEALANIPKELVDYTSLCTDMLVRINEAIEEKNITQKELASKLGKTPSEVSKWLHGEHNFTLKSICKLQVALGIKLLEVPTSIKIKEVENKKNSTVCNDDNTSLVVVYSTNEKIRSKKPSKPFDWNNDLKYVS